MLHNEVSLWGTPAWSWCVCVQTGCFCPVKAGPLRPRDQIFRLYRCQPKLVIILGDVTRRNVEICSHETGVYWRLSVLLPSQLVTTTTARKVRGKEVWTAPQPEEPLASSSEEDRSCSQRPRTAAAAKEVQARPTTLPLTLNVIFKN